MWKWIIGGLVALTLIGAIAGGSDEPAKAKAEPAAVAQKQEPAKDTTVEKAEPKPDPKPEPRPEPAAPEMTSGQENALESAQGYLDTMAFSRDGLIGQLSSSAGEGFSKADATFAADHVDVNWNDEAVESAQGYLDTMSFSKASLLNQLTSSAGEKFTPAQAQYAVAQVY